MLEKQRYTDTHIHIYENNNCLLNNINGNLDHFCERKIHKGERENMMENF